MQFAHLFTCDECAKALGLHATMESTSTPKDRFQQLADDAKRILVDWDTGRISRIELVGLLDRAVQTCRDRA